MGGVYNIMIPLLIHFIMILLNHGCCAQMTCAGWVYTAGTTTATTVYIWGEGKKFYILTKYVKKKYIFV